MLYVHPQSTTIGADSDAAEVQTVAVASERDDLPKHLEFIQDVVERHARTSFVLKGCR